MLMPKPKPVEVNLRADLPIGTLVSKQWKVTDKLGEGGFGAVYIVEAIKDIDDIKCNTRAALKAESNSETRKSFLKLEVQILERMAGRKSVAQLLSSGKKEKYSFMIMTLFGSSLFHLFRRCKRQFSVSTQVRLAMQILYGLKQLHEVGYIHRDVKPSNLAIGREGPETRIIHLLDFGLAREFVLRTEGKIVIRKPREHARFRGTARYCSMTTHSRREQGRGDDLWSMMYVLAEMRKELPWIHLKDKGEIAKIKGETTDEKLFTNCPPELLRITEHLHTLDYYARPDYALIFNTLLQIMTKFNVQYSDPFDWELQEMSIKPAKNISDAELKCNTPVQENTPITQQVNKSSTPTMKTAEKAVDSTQLPFNIETFSKK